MSDKQIMRLYRVLGLLNAGAAYLMAYQFRQTPNWMLLTVFLINVAAVVFCWFGERAYRRRTDSILFRASYDSSRKGKN